MTSPHLADTARRKYEEVGRGHGTRPSSRDRQNDPICMSQLTAAEVPAAAPNGGYFAWGGCADGAAGASADGPGGLSSDRGVVTFSAKGAPTMRYISM